MPAQPGVRVWRDVVSTASLLPLIVLVYAAGCGGEPGVPLGNPLAVKGKVTMDGQPAAAVDVIFSRLEGKAPPEARQFVAQTDANGEFSLPKVYPSNYQVMITEPPPAPMSNGSVPALDQGKFAEYGIASKLTARVETGSTEFSFDLKSGKK